MIKKMITTIVSIAALFLALAGVVYAAGNIDAANKWAWGSNVGWINFNPTDGGVTVYADHLEGYAWAENIGWMRLGTCTGGSPCTHANTAAANYGVNNDGSGNLSGYAWGSNVGWINFNPTHSQVKIDPATGAFDGYAWAENVGWIHFSHSGANAYGLLTTWRGSSGGGGDIYLPLIFKNFIAAPDLVVDSITTGSGGPRVTIRNAGSTPVTDAFWVDVYFNPNPTPPPLNRTWQSIAPYGANWGVTQSLAPGESLTLTVGGPYYASGSSSFPAGAQVYAYVDSINYATTTGNVPESNEANNVFGPVVSTAGGSLPAGVEVESAPESLPER